MEIELNNTRQIPVQIKSNLAFNKVVQYKYIAYG